MHIRPFMDLHAEYEIHFPHNFIVNYVKLC